MNKTCYSALQDLGAVFVLTDSKSEEWDKPGNISLESCSQIYEETGRVQNPVQFTGI